MDADSVKRWLQGTQKELLLNSDPTSSSPSPALRKAKKRKHYGEHDSSYFSDMESPPKRRREDDNESEIPVAQSVAASLKSISITQATQLSHSRTSSPKRQSSPTRLTRNQLQYCRPPLRFEPTIPPSCPASVGSLLQTLRRPLSGCSVIPRVLRERASQMLDPPPEYSYTTSDSPGQGTDRSGAIWDKACKTIERCHTYFRDNEPEGSWTTAAKDILETALGGEDVPDFLVVKDVQNSLIFPPSLLPQSKDHPLASKRTDLALAVSNKHPKVGKSYQRILTRDPTASLSQMSDAGTAQAFLPACVEIGTLNKAYLESSLQLAIWTFAGLQKLNTLQTDLAKDDMSRMDIPPLFGWTAIGLDWKLHIAYRDDMDGGVTVLGPIDCGGTTSLHSYFKLLTVIKKMQDWVIERYWPWVLRTMLV